MRDGRITVRFPATLRRRLNTAARLAGVPVSDVVRDAVEKQLAAEDGATAFERVKKAGLIGAVRSARRDVSTNRKYFEGFGKS
jgi:predicted DNA-binding protein